MARNGILAAGNWIIDHVKVIDQWPGRGMLTNIETAENGTGGSPYNILVNLAKMKVPFPLYAAGVIGNDTDGRFILDDLDRYGIHRAGMKTTDQSPTSYTDVMSERVSGQRTFFHARGANALLNAGHFDTIHDDARIFHLGYLLLLDALDAPDEEYGVKAARLFHAMRKRGYMISVDVVSEQSDRFRQIVLPCLPYVDYLVINEVEASASTGIDVRDRAGGINASTLQQAAAALLDGGVGKLVVIHFPEGGYGAIPGHEGTFVPSFKVRFNEIKGAAGAGDAFCAGVLYGVHQGLSLEETLDLANAAARFNLTDPTCTGGAVTLNRLEAFARTAEKNKSIKSHHMVSAGCTRYEAADGCR